MSNNISIKSVDIVPMNKITSLIDIMALHRPGDKALSEAMMINLMTHICFTRHQ